jgi:hypothetical protein
VLQIFRSVVDDPVARAAPAPADIIIIIDRPDPPTSIVAPNQNLRTTIPLKRNGNVNQQRCAAQAARAGRSARRSRGRCGSACRRARLARACGGSEYGELLPFSAPPLRDRVLFCDWRT